GGIISADSLNGPAGVALASNGGLFISDTNNNRVLHYPSGSTTADVVYGQAGSFSSNDPNKGGIISATSLNLPFYLAVDSSGGLYVADKGNNRILHYPSGTTTANVVYGQGGSFSSNDSNQGGRGANSLANAF